MYRNLLWISLAVGLLLALTACLSQDNASARMARPQGIDTPQPSAEHHASSTTEPVTVTEEPVTVTEEPVTVTEEPVIVTEEPVTVTEEPVSITEEPVAVTEEPVSITEEPAMVTEEPAIVTDFIHPLAGEDECGWKITFEDDFEEDSLNTGHWDTGYKAGDQEAQYYVEDTFELKDGILKIRAEERQVKNRKFASGILTTQGIFDQQYGRFEVRAKAPAGQGLWPAFWLLPSSQNYPWEIDVFEILGHAPNTIYMSTHWPDASGGHAHETRGFTGPDFSQDFHVFEIVWTSDQIVWLVDGLERSHQTRHVPSEPMFMLLNLAVGGKWPGYPDDSTPFPSYLEVDYVRVSEWRCP